VKSLLYMAWRYLAFNRIKTVTLVSVITVIIFLPLALQLVLDRSSARLTARASATPLLAGSPGSPLELVLNSLYFDGNSPEPMKYGVVTDIVNMGLAEPIPLFVRYRVSGQPVVGTSPDYFGFRELVVSRGRLMALPGEAVLGASAALHLSAAPGDDLVTSPETVFDVAGTYPLKLSVVGELAPTGTRDDEAVFVDVRTAWIIGGIGHGHEDLANPEAAAGVLKRDGENIVANAAVVQYREITPDNLHDFHFHGDTADFPLSAVITVPTDAKAGVLLEGRFQDPAAPVRLVRPDGVMNELLATVLTVRQYVLAAVLLVALATLATIILVFVLSARLRRNEILTMTRIGAAPGTVIAILATEVIMVLATSLILAGLLTGMAATFGDEIFRMILVSSTT
jgi:putative ABC transport system permease protein